MTPDIQLISGRYFNFVDLDPWVLGLSDVVWSLSHINRFTGHTSAPYSVAQHSVLCSFLLPEGTTDGHDLAYEGLMHDCAESVLGDVSGPVKHLLPDYKALEARVEVALFPRFGLPVTLHPRVKTDADLVMLALEKRDLTPNQGRWTAVLGDLEDRVAKIGDVLRPWSPVESRARFRARFDELGGPAKSARKVVA